MNSQTYQNPIIKGFHPDPSICIVGDDAYLVNSTFEYFPGVPIYHSKNLVDWTLISHCLTDETQLPLDDCKRSSGGIYAPTIRYNNGRFYMITTNVSNKGNFIVHTDDIKGKWSEPKWVDQGGIDPSLLFEDGKAYYCGTNVDKNGKHGIVLFEVNPDTGEVLSDKHVISYGTGGKNPEGPHLYHVGDYYYLMVAEGGTEYGHMETMLRSKSIFGPYESCPHNPILSNRNNMYTDIQCTGHADIAMDKNGNWWMCCLAVRKLPSGLLHNLGRETFLAPVTWENGWPKVGTDGCIYETMTANLPAEVTAKKPYIFEDNFSSDTLNKNWTFIRNKDEKNYCLNESSLTLHAGQNPLHTLFPTFVGIRQPEFKMTAEVTLSLDEISENGEAGICALQCKEHYFALNVNKKNAALTATLNMRIMDTDCVPFSVKLNADKEVKLIVKTDEERYRFYVSDLDGIKEVGSGKTAALCTEVTTPMTFTGVFIGLYAVDTSAKFKDFSLKETN